ncbi:MAG: glycan-binding surface protein, partial [Tannerellaceae bacterium]|nr:glycan-binding surface protein [Tannerellaceae bacterium]
MKKLNLYTIRYAWLLIAVICTASFFQACNDNPDKYESTDGKPEVYYVRLTDPATADSLVVEAYMGSVICLVGNNLRSINQLWFNDQKATLNTSFITDNYLIVTVPGEIPDVITNKMYLVTQNRDTVAFDFGVQVPNPIVASISNEYTHDGDVAILYGDYLIDDEDTPLTITMAGNIPVTEILSVEKTQVAFRIPEGAEKGYITVTTVYGTGRSLFQFRDDRGFILDWDVLNADGGWRPGNIADSDPEGITGNYVLFQGFMSGESGATWDEDGFCFNLWGISNGRPEGDLFDTDLEDAVLKFEVYVVEPWSSGALQMIFTPWDLSDSNGYYTDDN